MQTGTGQTGMQTFNQSLANAYFGKLITLETALSRSSNPDELQDMINRGVAIRGRFTWSRTDAALKFSGSRTEFQLRID